MRRPAERGFTLIELVLALSIVAVMVTILFGGMRVGVRAWQRGEERAATLQHARSINALLEQALAGTYVYLGQPEQNTVTPVLLFKGEADKLAFTTVSPPAPLPAPLAFTAVRLSIDAGAAPGLAIREKALPNFAPFDEEATPVIVDPSITAIHFRYLRPDNGSWDETWDPADENNTLPSAIEVTLAATINGQIQEQPPITVPIRVTTP